MNVCLMFIRYIIAQNAQSKQYRRLCYNAGMAEEGKSVRIVFETTQDVQFMLKVLAAHRNKHQKEILAELIREAAKEAGIEPPKQTSAQ